MMRYFVFWATSTYDAHILSEFETSKEVEDFLNQYVGNSQFTFRVIYGQERKPSKIEVATRYEF